MPDRLVDTGGTGSISTPFSLWIAFSLRLFDLMDFTMARALRYSYDNSLSVSTVVNIKESKGMPMSSHPHFGASMQHTA
ncbi:hypothetical protein VTL71DRAFT_3454 [Oculimacula yallundae]|uniref:Uncharacterized protein n=1 Tax=Oculimacula yallundae TaxID=86028 RepID=A0ABR4C770_9HELO